MPGPKASREGSPPDLTGKVAKANASCIALGPRSDVFEGKWVNDERRPGQNSEVLALKVLRGSQLGQNLSVQILEQLLSLAHGWRMLSHRNVLPVYGISSEFGRMPCVVMPLCSKGSVVDKRSPKQELDIIRDVADGLKFLHSMSVVHGNIKGSNILIRDDGAACITDYELTTILSDVELASSNIVDSVRWTAPEILNSEETDPSKLPYSTKSDVYAFAMTIIEIYTGKRPFQHVKHDSAVIFRVIKGERPERPCHVALNDNIWNMVNQSWSQDAADRLDMDDIVSILL